MSDGPHPATPGHAHHWAIALAGLVSLAVAMGIGRFAFTPLLPMMLHDQLLDLPRASWLASANYLGYLVGAVLCMLQPLIWRRLPALPPFVGTHWLRGGLLATGILTLLMALPVPGLWPSLRFAAGVASAFVFVQTSGWCLAQLGRLSVPQLGGVIYTGPGLGIVVSGLSATAMVAHDWTAQSGWQVFGLLALVLTGGVWRAFRASPPPHNMAPVAPAPHDSDRQASDTWEVALLTLAYGLAGFGYIITATFLPVIARSTLPQSIWLDLFWPLFGAGVITGALTATRIAHAGDNRLLLAGCFLVQALGVLTSVLWPTLTGFATGSFLLGLPFTAITFFAMQEVRRLRPHNAAPTMGLLTATYGIGQIAGPPLASWLIHRSGGQAADFTSSLVAAAASLLWGAGVFGWMTRRFPVRHPPSGSP